MKLKKYKTPFDSFIYGAYMPTKITNKLLKFYLDNAKLYRRGITNKGIETNIKDSYDIPLMPRDTLLIEYTKYLKEMVIDYKNIYQTGWGDIDIEEQIGIQGYKPGGGYKELHCERRNIFSSRRMLVFMTYLNKVKDGGTEFPYQNIKTEAEPGLTLLWPPDFTHQHKGIISHTKDKFIVTGWYSFQSRL